MDAPASEPPRLGKRSSREDGEGRQGEGGARGTYPAKSAEGQSSPLREEEKEKVTQGSVQARRSFIQQDTQSEQHRAEAGSRFCQIQRIPAPPRRTSDPGRDGTRMLSARGQALLSPF